MSFGNMVEQLNQFGVDSKMKNLADIMKENRASRDETDNAMHALGKFGSLQPFTQKGGWTADEMKQWPATFQMRVSLVLEWYTYAKAGRARALGSDEAQRQKESLGPLYERIVKEFEEEEPCAALLTYKDRVYMCTQKRSGHSEQSVGGELRQLKHRNPVNIAVTSKTLAKRLVLWKDQCPWCV